MDGDMLREGARLLQNEAMKRHSAQAVVDLCRIEDKKEDDAREDGAGRPL